MNDFLALLLCTFLLGVSFWLVVNCRCQHYEWIWGMNRCWYCGLTLREARQQGINLSHSRLVYREEKPDWFGVGQYVMYKLERDPNDWHRTVETHELIPDTPPEIREMYETMMKRRKGALG